MGFMKIFILLVPQLHWGLFTENSYGVAYSENGASLYLNDIELLSENLPSPTAPAFFLPEINSIGK